MLVVGMVGLVGLKALEGEDMVGAGVVDGISAGSIGLLVVKGEFIAADLVS